MENQQNRRQFLRQTPGQDRLDHFETSSDAAGEITSQMFREISLPLSYQQRYGIFRQLVWQRGPLFLEREDFKKMGWPKKEAAVYGCIWGAFTVSLNYLYMINHEVFFKRFMFTWKSSVFAAIPVLIGYNLWRKQSKVNSELYEKYAGDKSDIELLRLNAAGSGNKEIVLNMLLKRIETAKDREESSPLQNLDKDQFSNASANKNE